MAEGVVSFILLCLVGGGSFAGLISLIGTLSVSEHS